MPGQRTPTDDQLDATIALMLLIGVALAALIVLAGGILYLQNPSRPMPDYTQFRPAAASLSSVAGAVHGAFLADPSSLMQLGLMVLIATPVARVLFCIIGFARQRDHLYTLISATVFAILIYSLVHH